MNLATLSDKLDWLYKQTGLTYEEVESRTQEAGHRVTKGYQSKLRRGHKDHPGYRVLSALAEAFGVHLTFFYISPDDIDDTYLDDVRAMLNKDSRGAEATVALRSLNLEDEERTKITNFLKKILNGE